MFRRIMVTGGAGFIGSHLVERLLREEVDRIVVLDNFFLGSIENLAGLDKDVRLRVYREDARYADAVENIIEREMVELVYNLAVKPLPYSFIDPEGAFSTGLEITRVLATLLRRRKYKRLIHFSSSEVYGDGVQLPMNESHQMNPTTPYGAGKAAADLLLTSYFKSFDLACSIIRPFNAYGPRQNLKAYAALIPTTIRRILEGQHPVIHGDGLQTRDFTYISDIVEAACKMMHSDKVGEIINVGQGKMLTVKEVLDTMIRIMRYDGPIDIAPPRTGDIRRHLADISKARELLGYEPHVTFEDGIERTIRWFSNEGRNRLQQGIGDLL